MQEPKSASNVSHCPTITTMPRIRATHSHDFFHPFACRYQTYSISRQHCLFYTTRYMIVKDYKLYHIAFQALAEDFVTGHIKTPSPANPQALFTRIVFATLGTPAEFNANNIHEPGIAIPLSLGTVNVYVFVPADSGISGIRL